MIVNPGAGGGSGGVETVVGTISAGKYGLAVGYSDGNSYMVSYESGSITVLKNSIITARSDFGIQASGGVSEKTDILYSGVYFVSGDFSLTSS